MTDPRERKNPGKTAVGYCRPPEHSRFKPGQSGNPSGKPKGTRDMATIAQEALDEIVTVDIAGKSRKLTKRELVIRALVNKAAKGDLRACATLLELDARKVDKEDAGISSTNKQLIASFLHRMSINKEDE